jgi:hypothetical protein
VKKRHLESLDSMLENRIKMNLKAIILKGVDWIHLAQDKDQ